jgi:hypothetical protein
MTKYLHIWSMVFQETLEPVGFVFLLAQLCEGMKEKCALFFLRDVEDSVLYSKFI